MAVEEGIYVLLMLGAYVMRRAGTLSFSEKVQLLKIIGHMASHPDASYHLGGVLGSGRTIETLDQFQCIMPNSSHLFASDRKSTECLPEYQSSGI
ncbi:hypothetical protein [Dishui Lake phycodnavirus 2]|nr:hypothetical protein [Dishui Lake phycodnavirus 2]